MTNLKHEKQIYLLIRYSPIILILILSFIITYFLFLEKQNNYEKEIQNLQTFYFKEHQENVQNRVENFYIKINSYMEKSEEKLREITKNRVEEAYLIINTIYDNYKGKKTKEEIIEIIRVSLKNLKFNDGLGYYFIYDLDANSIMHGSNSSLEGKNFWNYKDMKDKYIFRDMKNLLLEKNETYYEWFWNKPNDKNNEYKKIGYFKLFEPYGIFIGTGYYLDDFEEELKKDILSETSMITFEHGNGYIFICDYDGVMLSHIDKNIIGKNKLDWKDEKGFEIIKEIIKIAKEGSGFLSYGGVVKPSSHNISFKTSFVKGFDKWKWAIGAGFYNYDLNTLIDLRKKEIEEHFNEYLKTIILFNLLLTMILVYLSIKISDSIKEKFNNYKINVESEVDKNNQKNIALQKEINNRNEYEKVINATCLVSITDIKGKILYANEEFCRINGYKKNEIIGKNHNIFRNLDTAKEFYENMWATILSGNIWKGINKNITKNGDIIYLNTTIAPLKNRKGDITRFIATRFDITDQMKMQVELKEKENILIQQSKMAAMGEMIGAIAHQWRQPLSVISTTASGIKLQNEFGILDISTLGKSMDSINNSVQHLSTTIDDFRNFFIPNKEKKYFSIKKSFEKVFKLVESQFVNNNIEFINNIDDIELFALENELIQVLINILNNAKDELLKLENSRKLIIITVNTEKDDIVISILDNAGGIKENIINKIFDAYFTTKESTGGTGIGLNISKSIIEKHMNGKLKVFNKKFEYENITYNGADFKVILPKK
jgi:two-component system, NtrC family, sensor kinase